MSQQPQPGQPAPQGWVYIEHPEAGRSENPVPVGSLPTWINNGWTEVTDDAPSPSSPPPAPAVPTAVPTTPVVPNVKE